MFYHNGKKCMLIEVIKLRMPEKTQEHLDTLRNLLDDVAKSAWKDISEEETPALEIQYFENAVYENDVAILLIFKNEQDCPKGTSEISLHICEALKSIGMIHHSAWKKLAAP